MTSSSPVALWQELVRSARALRARPGYALVAILTLAVGIGGSVVAFSVVDAVAFAANPYADAERLVAIYERSLSDAEISRWPVAPASFVDWRSSSASFERLDAYDYRSPVLVTDDAAVRVRGILMGASMFEILGARPALGRTLERQDIEEEQSVVVISDGLWTRAFGRDPGILGREIVLDRVATRVVGVMPPEFRFPFTEPIDVWRPLILSPEAAADRGSASLFLVGRLAPGVGIGQAREELGSIAAAIAELHPETNADRGVTIVTMREDWLEWRRPALLMFAGAAALALAITCLNLAGLMLSRGMSRVTELSVRTALGAGRARIAWLLIAEGWVLAAVGTAAGLIVATALLPALIDAAPEGWAGPLLHDVGLDLRAGTAAALLGLVTATLASAAPVLTVVRGRVADALRCGARAAGGRGQVRVRRALVLGQTVLAVVLLGQAGLLGRSLYNATAYDVGFNYHNVLTARVLTDTDDVEERLAFYAQLRERLTAVPGVLGVSVANIPPLTGGGMPVTVSTDGSAPGSVLDSNAYSRDVQYRAVDPEFFDLLEIPHLSGRTLNEQDGLGGERVALVNSAFVERVLGDRPARGTSFRAALAFQDNPEGFDAPIRIVGVVGDVAEWGVWAQPPIVYVPFEQSLVTGRMNVLLKTAVSAETLVDPLRETVFAMGNRLPLEGVDTLDQHHRQLYGMHDFLLLMVAVFALGAVVLASTGLYGVVALQVGQRTREVSVRMALGARASRIMVAVLGEGVALSVVGGALAAFLGLLAARPLADSWIGNFLHGVDGFDPLSFGAAVALLVATTVVACLLPARRASRVDPAAALRTEP